ncbi:MAG: phosphoenolpyruvate--protein phosphotransferase [Kiritimatiellaeota bacterium]|nr:phosphoenolpyruvate--protein phosphotransferase [Kiritimatiellota bacterium]
MNDTVELSDDPLRHLLTESRSVQDLLNRIVGTLATTWNATGCSIFLYNETSQKLVLRAVHGVSAAKATEADLGAGEGFIASVFERRFFRYTLNVALEADFVAASDECLREHGSVLAIPMLRGNEHIGIMVVQRPTGNAFTQEEMSAIRTATAQVGTMVEAVRALMMASEETQETHAPLSEEAKKKFEPKLYRGKAISVGIAIGVTRVHAKIRAEAQLGALRMNRLRPCQHRTLDEAIAETAGQLEQLQTSLSHRLPEATSMLFETHLLMLKDDAFIGKIRARIHDEGMTPSRAVAVVATELIEFFEASEHDYLQEKVKDVEDLALRLLDNLHRGVSALSHDHEASIIITSELLPSDILRIAQDNCQGIVLIGGASTAHVSLLVRSLHIPMIATEESELLELPDGESLILDCTTGNIVFKPSERVKATYAEKRTAGLALDSATHGSAPETVTKDGARVHLLANINLLAEVDHAITAHAEGIGLYRTEFPYLVRQSLPTEAEQVSVYLRLLDAMPDKPITIRTLDIGGDKLLSYFDHAHEENPALGLRSVRFTLRYPYVFDQQLRAILWAIRLRNRHDVRIMFPMIGSLEELAAVRERTLSCLEQIQLRDHDNPSLRPAIGTMVELPALVPLADAIAKETAFISIGTNDFIQYMLAVDRTNAQVDAYYVPHHPAVLHGLATVIRAALAANKEVSICGEMGADPRYIPFFLGLGVRHFSLEASQIPPVQKLISRLTLDDCAEYSRQLLFSPRMAVIDEAINNMFDVMNDQRA